MFPFRTPLLLLNLLLSLSPSLAITHNPIICSLGGPPPTTHSCLHAVADLPRPNASFHHPSTWPATFGASDCLILVEPILDGDARLRSVSSAALMQGIVWGFVPIVAAGIMREYIQEGRNGLGVSTPPGQYHGTSVRYLVAVMRAWRIDRGGERRGVGG